MIEIIEILTLLAIITMNMIFVISEIALLTASVSKLEKRAEAGSAAARQALQLVRNPNKMLSSVQVGITLMSMVIGLYGGNALGDGFSEFLAEIPYLSSWLGDKREVAGTVLAVIGVAYVTVLSEIVPKRIAMLYPEAIAITVVYFIKVFIFLVFPFVWLLTFSVQQILRAINVREGVQQTVSLDEIRLTIKQAEHSGSLKRKDSSMLQRLMDTANLLVNSVMTPRRAVVFIDINDDVATNIKKIKKYNFSNFPVIDGSFNSLIGFIPVRDLYNLKITNSRLLAVAQANPPLYIPETARVNSVIDVFTHKGVKIAVVVDEYGGFEGVVTLHDILKTFLGSLGSSGGRSGRKWGNDPEEVEQAIVVESEGVYCVSGLTLMNEIVALLDLPDILYSSANKRYRTVASFMSYHFNGIPKVDDWFEFGGVEFKVVRVDGFRIDRALISKKSEKAEE